MAKHLTSRFADFPPEIQLTRSGLHIQFAGLQDFLLKIGAVLYALQNDLSAIEQFLSPSLQASDIISVYAYKGMPL